MTRWLPLLLLGCSVEVADAPEDPGLDSVSWVLDWDTDGLRWTRAGWCTTTDLGHEVCVDDGRLVTAMTSLVACEDALVDRGPTGFGWWLPTAVAGHPGDADPSAWTEGRVEELADPVAAQVAEIALFGEVYCRAHWAVDAAWEGTADLEDPSLIGTTLELSGTVTDGRGVVRELEVHTGLAWGELQDVAALSEGPAGALPAEVHVVRELVSAFDGIELDDPDADIGQGVLRNLAGHTRFEVVR